MGTWYSVSTSGIKPDIEALFVKHFGENKAGDGFYATYLKDTCTGEAVGWFGNAIGEIANAWREVQPSSWRLIYVSMLCVETDPILVTIRPASFEVVHANGNDRDWLEYYRYLIAGTPEAGAYWAEIEAAKRERAAKEARRARMPRLDPEWPKSHDHYNPTKKA